MTNNPKPTPDELKAMSELPLPEGTIYAPPKVISDATKEDKLDEILDKLIDLCGGNIWWSYQTSEKILQLMKL